MTIKEEQDLVATIISQTKRINDLESKLEAVIMRTKELGGIVNQLSVGRSIYTPSISNPHVAEGRQSYRD